MSAVELPVLSLWQPYASLIFAWDRKLGEFAKAHETRGWKLPDRLVGKQVAIHATAAFPAARYISGALNDLCYDMFGCGYNYSLPRGAIIGVVRFAAPVTTESIASHQPSGEIAAGDWSHGRWAFPIMEAELLPVPVPAKGRQGWWSAAIAMAPKAETEGLRGLSPAKRVPKGSPQ